MKPKKINWDNSLLNQAINDILIRGNVVEIKIEKDKLVILEIKRNVNTKVPIIG